MSDGLLFGFYNRAGEPISEDEYVELMKNGDYKIVRQEHVGAYFVSTVWLGANMGHGGSILIFETMVFNQSTEEHKFSELVCERYSTEQQAFEGHERIADETRLLVKLLKEKHVG